MTATVTRSQSRWQLVAVYSWIKRHPGRSPVRRPWPTPLANLKPAIQWLHGGAMKTVTGPWAAGPRRRRSPTHWMFWMLGKRASSDDRDCESPQSVKPEKFVVAPRLQELTAFTLSLQTADRLANCGDTMDQIDPELLISQLRAENSRLTLKLKASTDDSKRFCLIGILLHKIIPFHAKFFRSIDYHATEWLELRSIHVHQHLTPTFTGWLSIG